MEEKRTYLGCLICTSQGIPLVTKILKEGGIEAKSSSYWKTVSQYICLSSGLWKSNESNSILDHFTFSMNKSKYFVVSRVFDVHSVFCCIEVIDENSNSNVQPYVLAYYLLHHFCRLTCQHDDSDGERLLSQLLEDIASLSQQLAEGTFADSIGVDHDEAWENFLFDHTIRDSIIQFEEFIRQMDIATSEEPSSYLKWLTLNLPPPMIASSSNGMKIYVLTEKLDPFCAIEIPPEGPFMFPPLESWFHDEFCGRLKDQIKIVSDTNLVVIKHHNKVAIIQTIRKNECTLIIANVDRIIVDLPNQRYEDISQLPEEKVNMLLESCGFSKWVEKVVEEFSNAFAH